MSIRSFFNRLPIVREVASLFNAVHDLRRQVAKLTDAVQSQRALLSIYITDFVVPLSNRGADPRRLLSYATQVCSQNNEDGVIHEIFRRIGTTNKIFMEIGVGDGTECDTSFLITQGWTGYWIDGNDSFKNTIKSLRLTVDTVVCHAGFVSPETLPRVVAELGAPNEFDFLSIDVDNLTFHLWKSLRDYRPRVVAIEYNSALPPDVEWITHPDTDNFWDGTQKFGASLKSLEMLGQAMGYSLVGCDITGINAFFVRSELTGEHFSAPFTADNHYEPPRYALSTRRSHCNAILPPHRSPVQ